MGTEIERKFLVEDESWRREAQPAKLIVQGYLSFAPERTVRVRIAGDAAFLTVKGKNSGASRSEFEYAIPVADARQMLDTLCEPPLIEKRRHRVPVPGGALVWEIDEFLGEHQGLVLAEIELESEDQAFARPAWLGKDVTDDKRYYNSYLARHPLKS